MLWDLGELHALQNIVTYNVFTTGLLESLMCFKHTQICTISLPGLYNGYYLLPDSLVTSPRLNAQFFTEPFWYLVSMPRMPTSHGFCTRGYQHPFTRVSTPQQTCQGDTNTPFYLQCNGHLFSVNDTAPQVQRYRHLWHEDSLTWCRSLTRRYTMSFTEVAFDLHNNRNTRVFLNWACALTDFVLSNKTASVTLVRVIWRIQLRVSLSINWTL
jgi:hypothetical protein